MQRRILILKICSIPILCVSFVLLSLAYSRSCYAACASDGPCSGTISDAGTISPVSGGSSTPPTASLTLSNSNMTSSAVTPGNTAITSTNVTVNVSNAASYSLTLSFAKTTLTGTTTINAGNATTDNTWGYKWDNAASYSTPSTTGSMLTVPALSNDGANFTKTLAFAAKFASNAEAGHYTNTGTLSLVASPKAATYTLADLTQMQQLAEGYAPDACKNTTIPSGKDYAGPYALTDVRDNNTYTVYKFKDNKCWMTENLKLWNSNNGGSSYFTQGRILKKETSNITEDTWTLPASSTTGFSDNTASNMYYNSSNSTGYYTWCTATAGTCTSATSAGQEAPSSICPKGWKLPTGGSSGEFKALIDAAGITSDTAGSTKIRGAPYNFTYTGYMRYDSANFLNDKNGWWWSSTVASDIYVYPLFVYENAVEWDRYMNLSSVGRGLGYAIRCLAQ